MQDLNGIHRRNVQRQEIPAGRLLLENELIRESWRDFHQDLFSKPNQRVDRGLLQRELLLVRQNLREHEVAHHQQL